MALALSSYRAREWIASSLRQFQLPGASRAVPRPISNRIPSDAMHQQHANGPGAAHGVAQATEVVTDRLLVERIASAADCTDAGNIASTIHRMRSLHFGAGFAGILRHNASNGICQPLARDAANTIIAPMDALMIGVSGMRGTIGRTLTPAVVAQMSAALAAWLADGPAPLNGTHFRVVFGRDSRPSGHWVHDAASAALIAAGIELIDLDIVTTPGVAMMVKHLQADAGIIATASHNPIQWNGLKFLNRDAVAPPPAAAAAIRKLYDQAKAPLAPVEKLIPPQRNSQTHALHVKKVLEHVDVLGISSRRFKVVLDSVNGAGCVATATLLNKLGCQLIHINNVPDGKFPHEPEPTEKNLVGLADEVRRQKAAVGFAQDPDADRLAIVDETGRYIGEEYSLALAARLILEKKKGGIAVTNLSSSRMLDDIAAQYGGRVIRTPVGEANVDSDDAGKSCRDRRRRQRRRDRSLIVLGPR